MKKEYRVLTMATLIACLLTACAPGQKVPEGWFSQETGHGQESMEVDGTKEEGTSEVATEAEMEPARDRNDGTGNGYFEIIDRDGQTPEEALFSDVTGQSMYASM